VTNGMYQLCVQAGSCQAPAQSSSKRRLFYYGREEYNNYPVIYVSWSDADSYCRWAGRRLPSEAEWEKAARGVDGRNYPWGNTPPIGSQAKYNNQVGDTTEVGSYPEGDSPYGVMDMAGNVLEWVFDWYRQDFYTFIQVIHPFGPDSGEYRVQRGGSWLSPAYTLRSAHRLWNIPSSNFEASGFRCASDGS
jgi:formylglycine-generating enzyme required for sulfatase activity